jgi:ABC-2 type transport system permease protein
MRRASPGYHARSGDESMNVWSRGAMLWGVTRYEFIMQVRRRWLWIVLAAITIISLRAVLVGLYNPEQPVSTMPLIQQVASISIGLNWLPMIAIGFFLADRFPRDRSVKVDELFEATPVTLQMRLAGKYFGSIMATLVPALLSYMIIMTMVAFYKHTLLVYPVSLLVYIVSVIPGVLFVAAFTLACTSVMWVPLYQFLFVGYLFWGNMLPPGAGLPTLAGTILTPIGGYISAGFFGATNLNWTKDAPLIESIASLLLLLIIPLLVMIVFHRCLKWEQSRK